LHKLGNWSNIAQLRLKINYRSMFKRMAQTVASMFISNFS